MLCPVSRRVVLVLVSMDTMRRFRPLWTPKHVNVNQ